MICNTVQPLKQFIVKTGRFVLFIVGILYLCHAAALTFSPDYYEWLQRLNSPRMPLFEIFLCHPLCDTGRMSRSYRFSQTLVS